MEAPMKPGFIPEGEEGWVWEKGALHTLFALGGLREGDQFLFTSRAPQARTASGFVSNSAHANWICSTYANPEVSTEGWVILAWRRPNAQHS